MLMFFFVLTKQSIFATLGVLVFVEHSPYFHLQYLSQFSRFCVYVIGNSYPQTTVYHNVTCMKLATDQFLGVGH